MNKAEAVYTELRARIVRGAYAPGQRLVLSSLAGELGTSSVPVREALRRLEAEGWVSFRPNVGAEVRSVDAGEWLELMDVLALAEGRATALAAPHLSTADIERARAHNEHMRAALERMDPLAAADDSRAFHGVLCEHCPNELLLGLVTQMSERLDSVGRTVIVFMLQRTLAVVDEHEHLLGLIERKAEEDVIERYARDHKLRAVTTYIATRTALAGAPSLVAAW